MNKSIAWLVGLGATLALVLSIVALVGGNQSAPQSPAPQLGTDGTRFPHGVRVGDSVMNLTLDANNQQVKYSTTTTEGVQGQSFQLASSSLCIFPTPAATSTLEDFSAQQTTASSTAQTWTLAWAVSQGATTSPIVDGVSVASAAKGVIQFNATSSNAILPPSVFVILATKGFASYTNTLTGFCTAKIRTLAW